MTVYGERLKRRMSAKPFASRTALAMSMAAVSAIALLCRCACAQALSQDAVTAEKVIIDTDIGDDIDDAFALALALSSDRVQVLGVTTAWGDTDLRARLVERYLKQTGHGEIPVAAGPKTAAGAVFTQATWAEAFPEPAKGWPSAVDFILDAVRKYPGQITLDLDCAAEQCGSFDCARSNNLSQTETRSDDGRVGAAGIWRPGLFT